MDWMKILSAVLLIGMLIFIFPMMRSAVKNSPKGSFEDWKGFIIPVAGVALFVALLTQMV